MEDREVCKIKKECYVDDKRILCVVARKELYDMHIKNFKEEGVILVPYRNKKQGIKTNNMCCSIDLIKAFIKLTDEEMQNTILYLSDPCNIIDALTNITTEKQNINLKINYYTLRELIKNSCQVITVDAETNQNVDTLLQYGKNKTIMRLKKFSDIPARNLREKLFYEVIEKQCEDKKYFMCACDDKETLIKIHKKCVKIVGTEKCLLINKTPKCPIDVANKFVFYILEENYLSNFINTGTRDVFVYIKKATILSTEVIRETTRNIEKIDAVYYYYCEKEIKMKYEKVEEVYNIYKNNETIPNTLNNLCVNYDSDDEAIFVENDYFRMYCYAEYARDFLQSMPKKNFENLLETYGFKLIFDTDDEYNKQI
jgi:hypothetical protein